jgi:hypothetical protein
MSAADPVSSVICGPRNCIRSLRLIFVESSQRPAVSTMAALVRTLHRGCAVESAQIPVTAWIRPSAMALTKLS